jgi:hypothetical protein
MNRYIDARIAFSYPEELRCTGSPKSRQYHLRRGSFHIFLTLPNQTLWKTLFNDAGRVRQVLHGQLDPQGQPMPTSEEWTQEYAEHGFQGRAKSILSRGRSGEMVVKQVDLVLSRDNSRIWLRVGSDEDFALSLVDSILENMTFQGEERHAEFQRLGPIKQEIPSPYVIVLRYFPKFGRKSRKDRGKYDVEYRGGGISDRQLQAVERFLGDEEALYEQAKLAIFRYYTEEIYPMASEIGRYDDLWPPCETVEEVMRLVKLSSLMVHEPREDGAVAIGLRFHCSWDEEHGLGLRAVGSTIEAVGTDFVALDSQ